MNRILLCAAGLLYLGPLCAQHLTDSNLPIIQINTYGQNIDYANHDLIVGMKVTDNGPGRRNHVTDTPNNYNGKVKIELHGSSSKSLPKKSWRVTPINGQKEHSKVPMLGMPAEDDWVLKGLYQDKTFLRDDLSFMLSRHMGHYASRSRFFELLVDGSYKGVYQMEERIKRDSLRVDIAKLKYSEISGNNLTGGYIIRLDHFNTGDPGWYSKYSSHPENNIPNYFLYYYPKPDSIRSEQKKYIKEFVDTFEDVLKSSDWDDPVNGYSKYINVNSFIDMFLITELSRNIDGYRLSSYFFKDKDSRGDGKLHAGPVWDYNIAWSNSGSSGGNNYRGWQYTINYSGSVIPFWWKKMLSDETFQNELQCRYEQFRMSFLSEAYIFSYIDSMVSLLDESQERNFEKWKILGQVIPPAPSPAPSSYEGEIEYLKDWVHDRIKWMDSHVPGMCMATGREETRMAGEALYISPNPFTGTCHVMYEVPEREKVKIELLNSLGEKVAVGPEEEKLPGIYHEDIFAENLPAGVYFVKISRDHAVSYRKAVKLSTR